MRKNWLFYLDIKIWFTKYISILSDVNELIIVVNNI